MRALCALLLPHGKPLRCARVRRADEEFDRTSGNAYARRVDDGYDECGMESGEHKKNARNEAQSESVGKSAERMRRSSSSGPHPTTEPKQSGLSAFSSAKKSKTRHKGQEPHEWQEGQETEDDSAADERERRNVTTESGDGAQRTHCDDW